MGVKIYRPDDVASKLGFCSLPSAMQSCGVCNSYVCLVRDYLTGRKIIDCTLGHRLISL